MLGWRRDEAVGQPVGFVFTSEDRAAGVPEAELETALTQGSVADERWHRRKDGALFFAFGRTQPLRDENGAAVGFLKIMRDRTIERQAEEGSGHHTTRSRTRWRSARRR